jgi:hypothetical protein
MKKLTLDFEELTVESFRTEEAGANPRGTVHGHYGTTHTEDLSCQTLCRVTCQIPCD